MSFPEPQSQFGWIDYNEKDAQRMREVLAAFDDKGTIDSLGLGVVRDAIADQLMPGISTIQTRARYFLFVPWICRAMEADRVGPAQFLQRLRQLETSLIESLREQQDPGDGVIGYRARERLSRLPSSIYWNGLGVFGIRQMAVSINEYRGLLPRLAMQATERDDDGEQTARPRHLWDKGLPRPPAGFPTAPTMLQLTAEESDYLVGKISAQCHGTLIAELARDLSIDRDRPLPWELALPNAPPVLREVLFHARNFSDLVYGAQVLYNLLLARRAAKLLEMDTEALQEELVDELNNWSAIVQERNRTLRDWLDSESFWLVVERVAPASMRTRRFVHTWAGLALADPAGIPSSKAAESLIIEREVALKGKLARLKELRALENWNGQAFGRGQMTFRWGNAQRILDDLQFHKEA